MFGRIHKYALVALLLAGSAILLYSCDAETDDGNTAQDEAIMTEYSEHLTLIKSENGRKSYHFTTPLMEGYSLVKDPYREFRKGVKIVTYKDDSVSTVDATLISNYAIHYTGRDLWEAKGNVVAETSERTLYTQQLFWNAKTKRIYSNVDSKIVQNEGRDIFYGEGFESDDAMTDWRFRRMTGRMEFEMRMTADSVAEAERAKGPMQAAKPAAPKAGSSMLPPASQAGRNKDSSSNLDSKKSSAQADEQLPAIRPDQGGPPVLHNGLSGDSKFEEPQPRLQKSKREMR